MHEVSRLYQLHVTYFDYIHMLYIVYALMQLKCSTHVALETRKTNLKTKIDEEYGNTLAKDIPTDGISVANLSIARSSVEEVYSEINGKAKDCKKLEMERKILEFHK